MSVWACSISGKHESEEGEKCVARRWGCTVEVVREALATMKLHNERWSHDRSMHYLALPDELARRGYTRGNCNPCVGQQVRIA